MKKKRLWVFIIPIILSGFLGLTARDFIWPIPEITCGVDFPLEKYFPSQNSPSSLEKKASPPRWNYIVLDKGEASFLEILQFLRPQIQPHYFHQVIMLQDSDIPRFPPHLRWRVGNRVEETRRKALPGYFSDPVFFQNSQWAWGFLLTKILAQEAQFLPLGLPKEKTFDNLDPRTLVLDLRSLAPRVSSDFEEFFQAYLSMKGVQPKTFLSQKGISGLFLNGSSKHEIKEFQCYVLSPMPLEKLLPENPGSFIVESDIPVYTPGNSFPGDVEWNKHQGDQADWIYKNKRLIIKSLGKPKQDHPSKGLILGVIKSGETLDVYPIPITIPSSKVPNSQPGK